MNAMPQESIDALRCAKRGRKLIYTFAGCISVNGRACFPAKNIRTLIEKGFMRRVCAWTVEITEEGELFINRYEASSENDLR